MEFNHNSKSNKQSFKLIEIPLNKFNDEAIPHHKKLYESHKATVHKLIQTKNIQQLNLEIKDKKRIVRQLKDLQYELETMRTQVEDCDLDTFDRKTFALRKVIVSLIKDYAALEKLAGSLIQSENEINENLERKNPFYGADQIQIQENLEEIKLKSEKNKLKQVESLCEDIKDLNGICSDLNQMVNEQKQSVNQVEANVEVAHDNVISGIKDIIKASKLKKTAYPITGALVGSIIGGPLGLIAGLKAGGVAALCCGVAGYTGGKFFKEYNDETMEKNENEINSQLEKSSEDDITKTEK